MAGFQERLRGAVVLNLPSILEEVEYLTRIRCFYKKNIFRKLRPGQVVFS